MLSAILSIFSNFLHLILGISTPGQFPPPLSHKEEDACFAQMEQGNAAAREKLILHNLRLVSHIVRKYYATAKNQEDLISIGTMGLIKAVDSFHRESGTRFATYGARCIQNEILMYFRAQKKRSAEVSLNDTIDVDRDGNPLTYMDVIGSEENLEEEVCRALSSARAARCMKLLLTERERRILSLRYGLSGRAPLTQAEVAKRLGISRSYVSRIEKSALTKLREAMT